MNKEDIVELLEELDARNITVMPEWVMASCVLAPWTHESGGDSNLSFGISIHPDQDSRFNCFTCHHKDPIVRLIELLDEYSPDDYSYLLDDIAATETLGPVPRKWDQPRKKRSEATLGEPLHPHYADLYDSAHNHWYMEDRWVSVETCKQLQLKYDPRDSQGAERILFPVFDTDGNLYGYSGRAIDGRVQPKVRDYHGLPKRLLLLGSHLVRDSKFVLLTEGLFDYARGWDLGFPTVASMHSTLTEQQADILLRLNKPVYCFFVWYGLNRNGTFM